MVASPRGSGGSGGTSRAAAPPVAVAVAVAAAASSIAGAIDDASPARDALGATDRRMTLIRVDVLARPAVPGTRAAPPAHPPTDPSGDRPALPPVPFVPPSLRLVLLPFLLDRGRRLVAGTAHPAAA